METRIKSQVFKTKTGAMKRYNRELQLYKIYFQTIVKPVLIKSKEDNLWAVSWEEEMENHTQVKPPTT